MSNKNKNKKFTEQENEEHSSPGTKPPQEKIWKKKKLNKDTFLSYKIQPFNQASNMAVAVATAKPKSSIMSIMRLGSEPHSKLHWDGRGVLPLNPSPSRLFGC